MSNDQEIRFQFSSLQELPKLAWCLILERGSNIARVLHGDWVEVREREFFEGAWAGDYNDANFDSTFMTGTGVRIIDNVLTFVAPDHTLDRINVVTQKEVLYVSNSLPFVLAASGQELDSEFLFYDSYFSSIRFGLKNYERTLPIKDSAAVHMYYHCNLALDGQHGLVEMPKYCSPAFGSFRDYRNYVDATILAIVRNAADRRRRFTYAPVSTISRGYDSPAATVLASTAGCRQVVSFRESRGTLSDEDCGTTIAEKLGLAVQEFDRLTYRDSSDFQEILNSGGPSEFLSFGDYFRKKLVFTGFHGDKIWDKNSHKVSTDLVRGDASGASVTEYRVRTGFCHLPVAFIGADSHPSIHAISNSNEMAPWSLGNSYDRPIARRIVEEAGIPRALFGQRKHAAGVVVSVEGLEATMSEVALHDFERYVVGKFSARNRVTILGLKMIRRIHYYKERLNRIIARVGRSIGISLWRVPEFMPHKLRLLTSGYLGRESLLFHWGTEKLVNSYWVALHSGTASLADSDEQVRRGYISDGS